MRQFFTRLLFAGLFLLGGFFSNDILAQKANEFKSITGKLVRITPKLSEIDRTSMYGQPLVVKRNENGIISHQTEEWKAAKKAIKDLLLSERGGDITPGTLPSNPTANVPTSTINYNDNGIIATGISPSDNNMAVGPNHIIQMINHASGSAFTVRSKTGTVITPVTIFATLTGQPGAGDPIVLYDYLANRWMMTEFDDVGAVGGALNIAISATADPTGSWFIYRYTDATFFPDYPKYSIWHNAYYASTQDFAPSFVGSSIWAFDRAAMLAGAPTANMVRVRLNLATANTTWGICAVSLEGSTPSGQSGLFAYVRDNTVASDSVGIIQFTPNFAVPASSIVSPAERMATLPFALGSSSAPTPGGGTWGTLAGKTMFKPTYRNFGTHESIVLNVTANDGTGRNAIKWFELRRNGGAWGLHQEGLYAPADGIHRYMGAITISSTGNIALLYNASSASASTSLRFTARNDCDPPGQMTLAEQTVITSSVNPPNGARNGDYNSLALDPVVPNSFWGVGQYNAAGTFQNWATRLVNFNIGGGCAPLPNIVASGFTLISESCVPANGVIDPGETVTVSFCLSNTGTVNTVNAVGTLQASGGIITPSGPQNYGVIVAGGAPVCRQFTFTNTSTVCGGTITASIQVQDGPDNLGIVTYPITLGTTTTVTSQNFDAVVAPALPAGWVATNAAGPAPLWETSAAGTPAPPAASAPNAAFINDPNVISDKILETPAFVPSSGARVTFQNNFILESGFDGGVLEISINGGAWVDIITAGGSFVTGGYNGTISVNFSNPLAGRSAWTGNSSGFITTTVTLPASAGGQSVRLRFRMGSDTSVAGTGWRIDNFSVSQPSCCGAVCTITCPANITVNSAPNQCGANVTYPAATTTGLCGIVTYSHPSGSFFPVGTTTVTATTGAGPSCSFTVTVVDATPPVITCPANITTGTGPGICGAVVNFNLPTVTDNCPLPGGVTLSQSTNRNLISTNVGIACGTGDNHFWRAYQLALSGPLTISSVRFGVEVNGTAQVATVRVYTSAGAFPGGTRTLVGTATVNLTTAPATFYTANFAAPPTVPGNAIVAIEVDVPTGGMWPGANTAGESAPSYISSATCGVPAPVTLASLGFTSHFIIDLIGTIPVVPPVVQQTGGLPSGSTFPVGTTTNTFLATDAAGNTSTCSFTVTVNDTEQPTITCPANQVRNTDPGQCYATYTPPQPTFADNCGVTRLTYVITQPPGFPVINSPATGINYVPSTQFQLNGTTGVGVTTITYTAADAAGNTRTCSFTVTVNDASIPVISTQPATKFVCAGSDAVFSIVASAGAGNPLTYQWQQWNGSAWVNITGATSATLTIPAVTFAQNTNSYRCVLTGRCSVVNSNFATLYINPLPVVTLTTSIPPAITPGQSLNIISTVSMGGGTYAWYKNGVLLTSPLQQLPVLSGLTVDDIGTYRLVYTDPNGCVGTSADVLVSGQASDKLWVYPVPNNGTFQVRFFNQPNESATIRVFDAKGAKVFERSAVTITAYTRIDVVLPAAIADGTYIVELLNSSGNRVGVKKIIVRKKP